METDFEFDWSRIEAMLKTWPGLARRPSPAELEALITAYAYPNGHDRAARCDPLELEDALRELIQEDEKGAHPMPRVVAARIGLRRARAHENVAAELPAEYSSEPAEDWVVAHALARDYGHAPLLQAVARRHGRNENPKHDEATCYLCEIERLEAAEEREIRQEYGDEWRRVVAAMERRERFERMLDDTFPWRVVG